MLLTSARSSYTLSTLFSPALVEYLRPRFRTSPMMYQDQLWHASVLFDVFGA
jgi:hypothetical protein